jgi:NifU-like protein
MTLKERMRHPKNVGFFAPKERGMRLAVGRAADTGKKVALYLLVDEMDGVIADAKFQAFGPLALVGTADGACELLLRKNYDQARHLSAELLERLLQEASPYTNLILEAIDNAADQCMDIPIADLTAPLPAEIVETHVYPNWLSLSNEEQLAILKEVVAKEITPYIALDDGGIEILKLDDQNVHIAYSGNCTTCYSATGSTLQAIEQLLCAKIHPSLSVIPDLSFLTPQG